MCTKLTMYKKHSNIICIRHDIIQSKQSDSAKSKQRQSNTKTVANSEKNVYPQKAFNSIPLWAPSINEHHHKGHEWTHSKYESQASTVKIWQMLVIIINGTLSKDDHQAYTRINPADSSPSKAPDNWDQSYPSSRKKDQVITAEQFIKKQQKKTLMCRRI